jgi:hypothetical protein
MEKKFDKELQESMEALWKQARETGQKNLKVTLKSGGETSLSKVIKTKEQADLFMRILKSYSNS